MKAKHTIFWYTVLGGIHYGQKCSWRIIREDLAAEVMELKNKQATEVYYTHIFLQKEILGKSLVHIRVIVIPAWFD